MFYFDPELIPERLIKIREGLNITKAQAARAIGLSPIGYARYEQGLRKPSMQMLQVIAAGFDTSVDYLTGMTDDPLPDVLYVSKKNEEAIFNLIFALRKKDRKTATELYDYFKEHYGA